MQTEFNLSAPNTLAVAAAQRDAAMAKVAANAGEEWNDYALRVVKEVADTIGVFTSDDVMEALAWMPHDNRALGAVMRRAAQDKIIVATEYFKPSRRRHCAPIRVWEYNLLPQTGAYHVEATCTGV